MALTESNITGELESRQPSVNKRLSKAIASVPRARYQKTLPKVPRIKRSADPSANSNQSKIQNPSQLTHFSEGKESADNNLQEAAITPTRIVINATSNSENNCNRIQNSEENTLIKNKHSEEVISIEKLKNEVSILSVTTANPPHNEIVQSDAIEKCVNFEDISTKSPVSTSLNIDLSSKICETEPFVIFQKGNTPETVKNKLTDQFITTNTVSALTFSKELPCRLEDSQNINAVNSLEPDASDDVQKNIPSSESSEEIKRSVTDHFDEEIQSAADHPVEEQRDVLAITVPAVSDRASKYPHLTSILSKKRAEPKKEVPKRRRKYRKGDVAPERSKMTMADLIYWNPTSSDPLGMKSNTNINVENISSNANEDDPEENVVEETHIEENNYSESVPKLIISEDGTINIDQVSLVVSRKPEPPVNEIVRNEETTYSSFRKNPLSKHWIPKETYLFYKALSLCGTDFGLMEKLFPHRTRRELKLKFKREEKYNIDLVNRAMYESHLSFDADGLKQQIESLQSISEDFELEQENNQPPEKRKRGRKPKILTANIECNDNELHPSPGIEIEKKKRGRKPKTKIYESIVDDYSSRKTYNNEGSIKSQKRKRKEKKLPEDFVDIEDVDLDAANLISEKQINDHILDYSYSKTNAEEQNNENVISCNKEAFDNSSNETESIEIVCLSDRSIELNSNQEMCETIFVTDSKSINLPEVITEVVKDINNTPTTPINQQNGCVVNLVSSDNISNGINVLNNVMANEVVTSVELCKKRKKMVCDPSKKRKTIVKEESYQPSSLNYTPVDDYLQVKLPSTPNFHMKTYSKNNMVTPEKQNVLITSLETPMLTPEHPNTYFTTLNVSSNESLEIPITPENHSTSNPVVFFTKSPSSDNVIHMFMYNNPITSNV